MLLVGTFFYCVGSAVVPLLNAEAYIAGVAALADDDIGRLGLWLVAVVAAAGQMVGKMAWYCAGRYALEWSWLRRKTSSPKWQSRLQTWQHRIGDRAWLGALILLVSAVTGFPPFAILSVIAGQLRVPIPVFLAAGMVGRTARFAAVLGASGWLAHLGWFPG